MKKFKIFWVCVVANFCVVRAPDYTAIDEQNADSIFGLARMAAQIAPEPDPTDLAAVDNAVNFGDFYLGVSSSDQMRYSSAINPQGIMDLHELQNSVEHSSGEIDPNVTPPNVEQPVEGVVDQNADESLTAPSAQPEGGSGGPSTESIIGATAGGLSAFGSLAAGFAYFGSGGINNLPTNRDLSSEERPVDKSTDSSGEAFSKHRSSAFYSFSRPRVR